MQQVATTVPPKGLGSLRWRDLLKGVYYAAVGQILYLIGFFFNSLLQDTPHFPTWVEWLPYVRAVLVAIGGYLVGKLGVNNVGQIFQKDKPTVYVDATQLTDLKQKADEVDINKNPKNFKP